MSTMETMRVNRDRARKHRENANAADARVRESIERSDTDGFLSQWAGGLTAGKERLAAEIAENGDRDYFVGLYQGDRRVKAMQLSGQYGPYWLLEESETALIAERGKPFVPMGSRSRVQKKLGLREAQELAPAYATIAGSGTGLSGAASCYVTSRRSGSRWGDDAELTETE